MDPEQQREIAAEGGRAAHAAGTAHEFTSEEARKAGAMSHKNDGNQQSDSDEGGSRGKSGGNQGSSGGNQGSSGSSSGSGKSSASSSSGKSGGSGSKS
ncbi:general stress protein YciG [Janthinobacterium sp. CG_23.3]